MNKSRVLMLGASYGSLLAMKAAMAGHDVDLVCLPNEADLINAEGIKVRLPVRGRDTPVELSSEGAAGKVAALSPEAADPGAYDLVGLAMQEPQYRFPEIRDLLDRVAKKKIPCLSIMNMPPLPFLKRIEGLDADQLASCYTDAEVWNGFEPGLVTLCSPDPQAFRPPDEPVNVLQVGLPTNFKAAAFENPEHTAIVRQLQSDIEAIRFDGMELPVKLKVHDSIFVTLAKWSMLLTGNYRCVMEHEVQSIRDAVHSDREKSREIYDWVQDVCVAIGADRSLLVPFEKYAKAAEGLLKPSSAARALASGAAHIERVDKLVQAIAASRGMQKDDVDLTVARVDAWLQRNRSQ